MGSFAQSLHRRDAVTDAETQCAASSYTEDSCYPVALTKFVQGEDASFVWNSALAKFRKTNRVNITIYAGSDGFDDSIFDQNILLQYTNIVNPVSGAGLLKVKVNDTWWGDKGAIWVGNISYPFFWTIWGTDEQDTFTIGRQPFFAAIQTALPDSIRATMVSTQAAPSSSSVNAGSITGSITSGGVISIPTGPTSTASKGTSSSRTSIIAGVVSSLVGLVLLLSLFFLLRRRRLARLAQRRIELLPEPILIPEPYEKQPLQPLPSSKMALDREMHMAHQRLQELQSELRAHPDMAENPTNTATAESRENEELRSRIAMLTDEVERLRSLGAEAPPAYSMQE